MGGLRGRRYVLWVKGTESLEGVGLVGKARTSERAPSFAECARPRQVLCTSFRGENVASEGEPRRPSRCQPAVGEERCP